MNYNKPGIHEIRWHQRLGGLHLRSIAAERGDPLDTADNDLRLRYVNNRITNNEAIRERFGIEKQNSAQANRILNEAVAKNLIRLADPDAAHKIKRYVPYWA